MHLLLALATTRAFPDPKAGICQPRVEPEVRFSLLCARGAAPWASAPLLAQLRWLDNEGQERDQLVDELLAQGFLQLFSEHSEGRPGGRFQPLSKLLEGGYTQVQPLLHEPGSLSYLALCLGVRLLPRLSEDQIDDVEDVLDQGLARHKPLREAGYAVTNYYQGLSGKSSAKNSRLEKATGNSLQALKLLFPRGRELEITPREVTASHLPLFEEHLALTLGSDGLRILPSHPELQWVWGTLFSRSALLSLHHESERQLGRPPAAARRQLRWLFSVQSAGIQQDYALRLLDEGNRAEAVLALVRAAAFWRSRAKTGGRPLPTALSPEAARLVDAAPELRELVRELVGSTSR